MGNLSRQSTDPPPLDDLFDDGPVTVLRWRAAPGWPITHASGSASRLLGRGVDDLIGQSFTSLVAPMDRVRLEGDVQAAVRDGLDRLQCEPFRLLVAGRPSLWVSQHVRLDKAADGAVGGFTAYLFDVSDREEAVQRERIKTSQIEKTVTELSALKAALDRHALVSVGDEKGRIIYANPKFCEASGYSVEELFGAPHSIFNSGIHPPEFFGDLWRTIRRGEIWQGEIANRRRDGRIFWVATTILPIRKPDEDNPDRFVAIRTDITGLKEQNDLLRVALDRAEEADRAKSMFLAQMSHEVRTPLNAILGFTELMTMEPYGPLMDGYHEALNNVASAGTHLKGLIDEVLDLASVESGGVTLTPEAVSVPDLIRDCIVFSRPQADKTGTQLRCLPLPGDLPLLQGDARRLRQMVLNLLANALKYASGQPVDVWAAIEPAESGHGRSLVVTVRDRGPGVADVDLQRLRQPFERGTRDPLRSQPAGVGLGLPLTERLVGLHGGQLELTNHPEGGLIARLIFPLDG